MSRDWTGDGPEYQVAWGSQVWTLNVADTRPGLRVPSNNLGPLLALEGVAEVGRWDLDALSGATLVGFERRFHRVEATYSPPGWSELTVRAAWAPWGEDGIDLEIQLSTQSVGQLRAVEVKLVSQLDDRSLSAWQTQRWVEPRDARSAGLSYDGRERDLKGLTTLPPRESAFLSPRLVPVDRDGGWLYAEMVHPQDVTRRIREGGRTMAQAQTTRYGLFGYDLEKGVVLRGRLRALWLQGEDAKEAAFQGFEQFLHEPPPLRT